MKRPFTQCKKLMGLVVFGVKVEQCFSLLRPEFDPNVDSGCMWKLVQTHGYFPCTLAFFHIIDPLLLTSIKQKKFK